MLGLNGMRTAVAALIGMTALAASGDVVDDALGGQIGNGGCEDAIRSLEKEAALKPGDDRTLFALGVMQALRGFEVIAQGSYRYGVSSTAGRFGTSFFPLAAVVPPNPQPEPVTLDDLRQLVTQAMEHARIADETLAKIDADFAVRADVLMVRMDFNNDGQATDDETVLALLDGSRVRLRAPSGEPIRTLGVDFDRGDADWLRGYCHLAMALGEFVLAHDGQELFDRAGHVLFPKNETPHAYLKARRSPFREESMYTGGIEPLDLLAFVHLMHFPVREPERMERVREHLLEAIGHSRTMWAHYDAETDDQDEWVPNPNQAAALPGAVMDAERRAVWTRFLDDAENLLEGRVLLPFWRGEGDLGVNAKRVFTEPTTFDPILWFQGTGAQPYLEEGDLLDTSIWRDLETVFDERTFRNMFWLN